MINKDNRLSKSVSCFAEDRIEDIYIKRLKTGFPMLDELLGGGMTEGTTVLGAISGLGKSTFALQLAQNVAKAGTPVLFFSLEMPAVRIASKAISRQLFLDTTAKKQEKLRVEADMLLNQEFVQKFDKQQWEAIDAARQIVASETENLYIIEGTSMECYAENIKKLVEEFIDQEQKTPLVIVDYLQILPINDPSHRGDNKFIVESSMYTLRSMANEKHLPLLLISSLNRESYSKSIRFEAFKETGSIEYSADEVIGLQFSAVNDKNFDMNEEKSKNPRDVEMIVLKQRYGKSGDEGVKFDYYAQYDCFSEREEEETAQNVKKSAKQGGKTKAGSSSKSKDVKDQPGRSEKSRFEGLPDRYF